MLCFQVGPSSHTHNFTSPGSGDTQGFGGDMVPSEGPNPCVCRLQAWSTWIFAAFSWLQYGLPCSQSYTRGIKFTAGIQVPYRSDCSFASALTSLVQKDASQIPKPIMLYMDFLWILSYVGNSRWIGNNHQVSFFPAAIQDILCVWLKNHPYASSSHGRWGRLGTVSWQLWKTSFLFFPNYFISRGIRFPVSL